MPHYPPKPFPLNLFADPHPLNPVLSIFYENTGGKGPSFSATFQPYEAQTFKQVPDLSPSFSSPSRHTYTMGSNQLLWNQLVAHSVRHDGGCTPSPSTLSPAFCVSPYFAASLAKDSCSAVGTMQRSSGCRGFFAGVAHSEDARRVPGSCGSRDVADFFAVEREGRFRLGDNIAGKGEADALAVDLATGADARDDFLAGVAAFGVADVAVLQAGFVGDLFFAEVVAEPGDALSEAGGAQGGVAHRAATVPASRIRKNLPKLGQFFALGEELRTGDTSRRTLRDPAGNRTDRCAVSGKFFKLCEVGAGNFFDKSSGLRTLQRQGAVARRLIGEGHVIHDDVFVEPFDEALANHGVGHAEEPVRKGVRLYLRENVSLRIEQQRNDAVACGEILDVVRQDGVQVADAVGPGKGKIGAVILVDQGDSVSRGAILGGGVAKVIRQGTAEPNAHLRAGGKVHGRKRSVQGCNGRSHFHDYRFLRHSV